MQLLQVSCSNIGLAEIVLAVNAFARVLLPNLVLASLVLAQFDLAKLNDHNLAWRMWFWQMLYNENDSVAILVIATFY